MRPDVCLSFLKLCREGAIFQTFPVGENLSGAQSKRLAAWVSGHQQYLFEIQCFFEIKNENDSAKQNHYDEHSSTLGD